MKKLILSLVIGIIGVLALSYMLLEIVVVPPVAYPSTLPEIIVSKVNHWLNTLPSFLGFVFSSFLTVSYFIFIPLSIIGIILARNVLKIARKKLAVFAIILNLINLIFSFIIAWLLFGLARGL